MPSQTCGLSTIPELLEKHSLSPSRPPESKPACYSYFFFFFFFFFFWAPPAGYGGFPARGGIRSLDA